MSAIRRISLYLVIVLFSIFSTSCATTGIATKQQVSLGTGFVVNDDGYIITAYHVVKNKNNIYVKFAKSNRWLPVVLSQKNEADDLALLHVGIRTVPLNIAGWNNVPVGLEVYAIGYPLPEIEGGSIKISQGIINSDTGIRGGAKRFQFNAGVQKGLSGGPIISPDGLLIGLVQSKLNELEVAKKTGDMPQSINYGIKSDYILQFLKESALVVDASQVSLTDKKRPYEILASSMASVVAIKASDIALK